MKRWVVGLATILFATLLSAFESARGQQSQIFVDAGQTLTRAELSDGEFQGQEFDLAPDTVFEIASGGILGPVSNPNAPTGHPFDFAGSAVRISAGGQFGSWNNFSNEVSNVALEIQEGGSVVGSLYATTSTVNISGGAASSLRIDSGSSLNVSSGAYSAKAFDSSIDISGGSGHLALYRSSASISGGEVRGITLHDGSIADVRGGTLRLSANSVGSTFNPMGGVLEGVGGSMRGELNATGGVIGRRFRSGSGTTLIGGEFYFNGSPYTQPTISFVEGEDAYFSGTLADGSPFVFSQAQRDELASVELVLTALPAIDTTPAVVDASSAPAPNGLRRGQSLTLGDGGRLATTTAVVGSTLVIDGGHVGDWVDVYQSEVQLRAGTIGSSFHLLDGSSLEVSGGSIDQAFVAYSGSTIDIAGGHIASWFLVRSGSTVAISGGSFGDGFRNELDSVVSLAGGEFELNGAAYTGSSISLSVGDTFSGTFQDGSPFIFGRTTDQRELLLNVQLNAAPLPVVDLNPIVVSQPSDSSPSGLRRGQTLTLDGEGALRDNFEAVNATINVTGGSIGDSLSLAGGEIDVTGGQIGDDTKALHGSVVNISGGTVGDRFIAASGSSINISGGNLGRGFLAEPGSAVTISGGAFGEHFVSSPGATLTLVGNEFMLNGIPYTEEALGRVDFRRDILTGTLADGTTFVFADRQARLPDSIANANLVLTDLPEIDSAPLVVDDSTPAPKGLRAGQTVMLESGGTLRENFAAIEGKLIVTGGRIGAGMQAIGSHLEIAGGTVGDDLEIRSGSTLDITGGTIEGIASIFESSANVRGGRIGRLLAQRDSVVNISGGQVSSMPIHSGGTYNVSGGIIQHASATRGTLNLFVRAFLVDDVPMALARGSAFEIETDYGTLYSAILLDGSRFDFSGRHVRHSVDLNVTLIPEPRPLVLLTLSLFAALVVRGLR